MELSSALFTRVASGISRGQAVWALLTLNEYEVDSHLRTALVSRASAALSTAPISCQLRTALTSGKRLSQFSKKQQEELKSLMHLHRPTLSTVKRFIPSPAVNAALVRNRTTAVRHALVAHSG
jgi:hypothetical protein